MQRQTPSPLYHPHGKLHFLAAAVQRNIDIYRKGLDSQYNIRPYSELPDELRIVRYNGVLDALRGGTTPETLHNNWRGDMTGNNWNYGAPFSIEDKTHPNMMPYGDLTPQQQYESVLFLDTVVELRTFANL